MVFPTRNIRKHLSADEENEIFSYIFSGILFEKGILSSSLSSENLGAVEATVIRAYEIAKVLFPHERIGGNRDEGWFSIHSPSGNQFEIAPSETRALQIMFRSHFGKIFAYVELSFGKSGYTLDCVSTIPENIFPDLNIFSFVTKTRIIKLPNLGQRALLIESDKNYVIELPDISDKKKLF